MDMASQDAQSWLRLASFILALTVMTAAEAVWPRRPRQEARLKRWPTNMALVMMGALAVRLLSGLAAPLAATGAALWAQTRGVGLLNAIESPRLAGFFIAVLALDFVVWAQHRAFHAWPWAWRMHHVHHADRDIDASTALRFHPLEIALSALIKSFAVVLLGAPAAALLVFEILLNASAIFNHANTSLPPRWERFVRTVFVTPDMHRIHHSVRVEEHNTNFGFFLSIWDRLFRTYSQGASGAGGAPQTIGLEGLQDARPQRLVWSLRAPFSPRNERTR